MMKLTVKYFHDSIDEELDEKIIQTFENLGFEWNGQGYDLERNIREIFFNNPNIRSNHG